MKKKLMLALMCFTLIFAVSGTVIPGHADAAAYLKTYKSPKGSFKQPTTKQPTDNVTKTQPDTTTKTPAATTPTTNRGFFGGGFAKGLFLGGMAGLLFGGLFGNMGFLGSILGLFVNILTIVVLIMLVRKVVTYFINRRRYQQSNHKRY